MPVMLLLPSLSSLQPEELELVERRSSLSSLRQLPGLVPPALTASVLRVETVQPESWPRLHPLRSLPLLVALSQLLPGPGKRADL